MKHRGVKYRYKKNLVCMGLPKIRNATHVEYNGIKFRSKSEADCYKIFEKEGIILNYETDTITLWEGMPEKTHKYVAFWSTKAARGASKRNKASKTSQFKQREGTVSDITYTPDFSLQLGDNYIFIEVKGFPNDAYPLKRKMFLKYLETMSYETPFTFFFFEVYDTYEMRETLKIIQDIWTKMKK